ncbi:hypothetical protein AbraIFM66951_007845 [Aspergillus brasiliensis]|uniref:Uncharacterized protein n=1 Tax=Aspergillus brasiliensis TaxID=319629 RepID=A0A9W5YL76_9EURO|nr:hypothetical protein AbraCBS73388_010908 [Aspergillus brasiliensis]GKZ45243.1 hypothetical protein AbraIFM66951_007845 [Aspergillus brasiliensis]
MSTHPSLPTSTTLALTTQYPPHPYRGIQDCKRAVLSLYDHIYPHPDNTTSQYLSYNNITPASFHSLRRFRHRLERHVRFTYFPDISTVLIKVQTPMTRKPWLILNQDTNVSLNIMGVDLDEWEEPFNPVIYTATGLVAGSQKEADSTHKNGLLRSTDETDWPNWVIESGLSESESLSRLHQDVNWWIGCSGGQVLLVLVFVVSSHERTLTVEKYFPQQLRQSGGPVTRARAAEGRMPQLVSRTVVDLKVNPPAVEGPPVVLEFERMIGRQPVGPDEHDVVFGVADLIEIGEMVFCGIS